MVCGVFVVLQNCGMNKTNARMPATTLSQKDIGEAQAPPETRGQDMRLSSVPPSMKATNVLKFLQQCPNAVLEALRSARASPTPGCPEVDPTFERHSTK